MRIIDWLLDSDPAIRWQAMRDLTDADPAAIAAERARVAHEGLGAEILARQAADGAWHDGDDPAWFPTLYTLLLLRATGVDPADPVVDAAVTRLAAGFRWDEEFGEQAVLRGRGRAVHQRRHARARRLFRPARSSLARRLLDEQLDDGGWNCDAPKSARSSFHSTICVLEGLLAYERAVGRAGRRRGPPPRRGRTCSSAGCSDGARRATWSIHRSCSSRSPARYYYDVLRGLDYLRAAGVTPDERVDDGGATRRGQAAGRRHAGCSTARTTMALDFAFGESVGEPSRWNTLRALRVLRWHEGSRPAQ